MSDLRRWFPIIVLANRYHFARGERIVQACRQSRMLLWCRAGRGVLKVDRRAFEITPGRWLLLPWGTSMCYHAHARQPFVLAAVHWIPHHCPRAAVAFDVAHDPGSPLFDDPARRADETDGGVQSGDEGRAPALLQLGEFILSRFAQTPPQPRPMRLLAELLIEQVTLALSGPAAGVSHRVRLAQRYAAEHLSQRLGVDDLARAAGCSRATLTRLFARELGSGPAAWLSRRRIERACELLRSTSLPIHAVARQVGMDDPYYFARCFRRHMDQTARQYRSATPTI